MSKLDKIEELQTLLKEDSFNFQARRELAFLLVELGYNEEALTNLLILLKHTTDDSEIYYNLGIVYEKLKQFEKAENAYENAVNLNPDELDFVYNLGLVKMDLQ